MDKLKKKKAWLGLWTFTHKDKNGKIISIEERQNALADEGEQNMLDQYFRGQNAPAGFFIRLVNDTPVETDSLSDLTGEPSGNGYTPQALARSAVGFPTLALDNGDFQITSATVTFTASGGSIGPVSHAILATSSDNTGRHIAFVALSQSRTMADGESLDVSFVGKLQ